MQEMCVQSLDREDPLRRKWKPTSVFLPRKSHGQRSLVGYSPWVANSWIWLSNWACTHLRWLLLSRLSEIYLSPDSFPCSPTQWQLLASASPKPARELPFFFFQTDFQVFFFLINFNKFYFYFEIHLFISMRPTSDDKLWPSIRFWITRFLSFLFHLW